MSWQLLSLAKQCRAVRLQSGAVRKMRASEKAVLKELAELARDGDNGRVLGRNSQPVGAGQIAEACGISLRAVRYALRVLVISGHITRTVTVNGEAADTHVHPQRIAGPAGPLFGQGDRQADPPRPATARGPIEAPPARERSEIDQVYDAWNEMSARHGLPGPIKPDGARDAAIETALKEHKLWILLAGIRRVPENDWLSGRSPTHKAGQADFLATFDYFFKVNRYGKAIGKLDKLLDGSWHKGVSLLRMAEPAADASPAAQPLSPDAAGDPLRRAFVAAIGPSLVAAWTDKMHWSWDGDVLSARSASRSDIDYVAQHFGFQLRNAAAGLAGRPISVRYELQREAVAA